MKSRRSKQFAWLAPLALLCGVSAAAADPSNDELFEKVFKKKPSAIPIEIPMPIFYEDLVRPLGMIQTQIGATPDDLKLENTPIFAFITKLVDPTYYKPREIQGTELEEQSYEGKKWIPISVFKNAGYRVVYNESRLEIRIYVPPEMRKLRTTSLSRSEESTETENPLSPSIFSTFLNINANQGYQTGASQFTDGRQPLRAQLDSGINFASWVLESNASYVENKTDAADAPLLTRGDVRLVKDYTGLSIRQSIGDLNYPTRGVQTFRALGGASLTSNFGLEPTRLTVPTGNYEVYLKRPSRVAIFINDQQRQVLDLPAGKQSFRDFPFTSGLNDLRLEITDDLGQTETVLLSYFSNSELLKPGIHQVNYAIGAPSTQMGAGRYYDASQITVSAFHRFGLLESLTLGANLQGDRTQYLVGAEAQLSTKFGFFQFEPSSSSSPVSGVGYSLRGRYLYSDYEGPKKTQRSFTLAAETTTPSFSLFGMVTNQNVTAYDFSTSYSQAISKEASANVRMGYQFNRNIDLATENSYRVGLGLSRRWSNGIATTINFEENHTARGVNDASLAFFLIWSFTKERQFVTASYNPKNDSTHVTWNATPANSIGGTSAQVGVEKRGSSRAFDGRIQNVGNRAIAGLTHRSDWEPDKTNPTQLTALQLGTSLVYADGHFGLTRPVFNSFLIVSPVNSASGQTIELNPQRDGGYAATTDFLNNAIMPELPSYNRASIILGTQKLKLGTSIDEDHFTLYPTYKSGYSIEVGSVATVAISLVLLNPDSTPIAMQPGEIRRLNDSSAESITVFTGRRGQMRAQGFRPGKYELRLFNETWYTLEFEIPDKTEGVYELGQIMMKLRPK